MNDQEEPERLSAHHVHRALALVEQCLRGEEGAAAVRKQTGGNAPELVQGIIDSIHALYLDHDATDARIAELEGAMRLLLSCAQEFDDMEPDIHTYKDGRRDSYPVHHGTVDDIRAFLKETPDE